MQQFFKLIHTDANSRARIGEMHTDHGVIRTPAFMPVGTQATVKTLDIRDLHEIGTDIILNNTYHLHLRPNEERIREAGGVHAFSGWNKPILTDSGGFQVFSLGQKSGLVSIDTDGVDFISHIDGSRHRFTPESAIRIQQKLGADIIMAFDQCTADNASMDNIREAMNRTHRWAERCLAVHEHDRVHAWKQFLFGIIQGGNDRLLRQESARYISGLPFDGIAIGGESIGYFMDTTADILDWIIDIIPDDKPRYTMGLGTSPRDILTVVERGVDMFDCVSPTRMARNGGIFVREMGEKGKYRISLPKSPYKDDMRPLCAWCQCRYCKGDNDAPPVTRSYMHHLFRSSEILGPRIASYHNLFFMEQFMRELRASIEVDRFYEFKKEWLT